MRAIAVIVELLPYTLTDMDPVRQLFLRISLWHLFSSRSRFGAAFGLGLGRPRLRLKLNMVALGDELCRACLSFVVCALRLLERDALEFCLPCDFVCFDLGVLCEVLEVLWVSVGFVGLGIWGGVKLFYRGKGCCVSRQKGRGWGLAGRPS